MKNSAKVKLRVKKAKAKIARKKSAAAAVQPREGTKNANLLDLMRRPGGATMAELLKATGWKRCTGTMRVVARQAGYKVVRHPGKAGAASMFAAR